MDESKLYDFVLKNLDLRNKVILDAAVGAGVSTYFWARRVHEQGGSSRIISIDVDLAFDIKMRIKDHLGEYDRYVQFKEADIFDLAFLEDVSIDIVNCDNTIVFLSPKPLKLLSAFAEFHRVLRPSGDLIITSEIPVEDPSEGQWKRWNLAKAIYSLKGEIWSTEPLPDEVKEAVGRFGFLVYDEETFPPEKNFEYKDCANEWRNIMLEDIKKIPWNGLKGPLTKIVHDVYEEISEDGYVMTPARYVLKCKKTSLS